MANFKYNHVLALNPYFGSGSSTMGLFPATGLEYIVASIKDLVGKVTILDLRYEEAYQNSATLNEFIDAEIDLVCITIGWNAQFRAVRDFVKQLSPGVTTIVGGHVATQEVEYCFDRCPNIDMIVRGEGEQIIREIVAGVPMEEIRGLSYRKDGKVIHNENQELPDVATLRYPDRSLRTHDYRLEIQGVPLGHHTFDTILTTRGCPFKCKFCTFSLNPLGQKRSYTERPLESVIEELKTIDADVVLFSDDNFFTNPKRSERLCDLIIENKIKKIFVVQARIDMAKHPTILDKAEKAGFRVFLIGIESPHDWILEQLAKGITQEQIRRAFAVLSEHNFYLHGYFIYGNVGETEEEMLYIAQFARELKLDSISFQKLRVEKFSPLKELVDNTPGYYYNRIGGPVYSDKLGRKELKQIRDKIRRRFYTPRQWFRMIRKAWRTGLIDTRDVVVTLARLPRVLYRLARQKKRKRKATEE